ncbi:hypothetical protein [Paraclostridium bifermentans]|uniref:hypothetical protein n=1 Tax=Paraclostridium bifermentans TaxID=1490 RepID=UPI0034DF97E5
MKNNNIYIFLGLLINSSSIFLNTFGTVSDFTKGLLFGIGIGLIILGIYYKNHDLSKFKKFKYSLFSKIFSQ